jgi:hypothetical protein
VTTGGGLEHLDLDLSGSPHVALGPLKAREANIRMSGAGEVRVAGRSDRVLVSLSGHGTADLARLAAREADIRVSGSGKVMLTPRETADISVSGAGLVVMASRPARLSQSISGSGRIRIDGD